MVNDFKSVQRQTAQYDLFNRLHSIAGDEAFVRSVAEHYGGRYEKSLEAIRVKAEDQPISDAGRGTATQASNTYAYFKSTDGHTGTWNFNLRRSNLPLASRLDQNGGYVQTLRAGGQTAGRKLNGQDDIGRFHPKREVINRAIARTANHTADWDTGLHLPPMIPPTERSQIEEKLESWVDALCASSLTLPSLSKPLRPFWIHPATRTPPTIEPDAPFTPVICVSASKWVGSEDDVPAVTRVQGGRTVGFSYVQGAGDDDELWSRGLSPAVYYQNKAGILEADKDDLAGVVDELVSLARTDKLSQAVQSLNITDSSVSTEPLLNLIGVPTPHSRLAVQIGPPISPTPAWTPQYRRKPLSSPNTHTIRVVLADKQRHPSFTYAYGKGTSVFACPSARAEPKAYGMALDELVDHLDGVMEREDGVGIVLVPGVDTDVKAARQLQERPGDPKSKTGDVEVDDDVLALPPANPTLERMLDYRRTIIPIALVLLLSNPDLLDLEDASHGIDTQKITKKDIGDMLHRLVALWPDGNPPRAALKRVNEYLMSPYA